MSSVNVRSGQGEEGGGGHGGVLGVGGVVVVVRGEVGAPFKCRTACFLRTIDREVGVPHLLVYC